MLSRFCSCFVVCLLLLAVTSLRAQTGARAGYDVAYIGPPLEDPVLQQSKETYVVMGCAYCYGMYLMRRGEAADLMQSALVGADVNGNLIGPLLRAGVPKTFKLSPMPQYSDLSERQIADITRWIHYARQRGRHQELIEARLPAGDPQAGRTYFDQNCATCHAPDKGFSGLTARDDEQALRAAILEPQTLRGEPSYRAEHFRDTRATAGRLGHGSLLENYSAAQVANLIAYLHTLKQR